MGQATFADYVNFAVEVTNQVLSVLRDAETPLVAMWALAMTNAACLSRISAREGRSANTAADDATSVALSTEFGRALISILEEFDGEPLTQNQSSDVFAAYNDYLLAALKLVDDRSLKTDPNDLSVFITLLDGTLPLTHAETTDDRMALSIISDLVMAKLNWQRPGPSSSYGFVRAD